MVCESTSFKFDVWTRFKIKSGYYIKKCYISLIIGSRASKYENNL